MTEVLTQLFIGGAWVDAADGATLPVDDPATGEILCHVADAGSKDARLAEEAAVQAQTDWARTPPRARSEILRRAYEIIIERTDELAHLMTSEMGKPLAEARGEVAYAAEFFRWFSEEAVRIDGGLATLPDGRNRMLLSRRPVGPCLLITPWNFPLAMGTRKIGPAIAAGCTMVLKPAPQTPLSSLALAGILKEAGLPDGVLNVVTTSRAGEVCEPLLRGGRIRKLSFTGSTAVGRLLLAQCADTVVRTSMELGGNAPFIVFDDADLDVAVDGAMVAKMRNMGEACTAANRFFVHRSVADEFGRRLAERMGALVVGPGTRGGVDVGPLIDAGGRAKVEELVADAVERGAEVLVGGRRPEGPGNFYPPTVLAGVDPASRLMDTEIFGPVAAILTFDDEDEVLRRANDTPWGLVGYVFTQGLDRGLRVSEGLEVGMVGLNTGLVSNPAAPFGGVKQSGLGREGGRVGLDEFLEYQYVAVPVR
ncbi:NAD-dependent succinate-semialdehyde dehydrogenase [Streptomyces collinus]|uniref:NAD-dependent succinate-semialdehyde dehydrogenase n=1 Tax=Streptomyces collinus TaxID=42684 RepID=UPI00364DA00D